MIFLSFLVTLLHHEVELGHSFHLVRAGMSHGLPCFGLTMEFEKRQAGALDHSVDPVPNKHVARVQRVFTKFWWTSWAIGSCTYTHTSHPFSVKDSHSKVNELVKTKPTPCQLLCKAPLPYNAKRADIPSCQFREFWASGRRFCN